MLEHRIYMEPVHCHDVLFQGADNLAQLPKLVSGHLIDHELAVAVVHDSLGGVEVETARIAALAKDFRQKIAKFDFEIVSESMSNAVTPLHPKTVSAYKIFTVLKDEYDIWVCPNGGELADKIFRVGHIGHLTTADNDTLIAALDDMKSRGIF